MDGQWLTSPISTQISSSYSDNVACVSVAVRFLPSLMMVPMENGGLANVDYDATEGTPRFNVGAPRHQLGIKEGNPELDHLFTHHPRGSNLTSPEEVNSLLDEMSTKPLSPESVNKNRKWMQIVKSTQEDG